MSARKLDARTLRVVARRLGRRIRFWEDQARKSPSAMWLERCEGKGAELTELRAELLFEARAIERAGGKHDKR